MALSKTYLLDFTDYCRFSLNENFLCKITCHDFDKSFLNFMHHGHLVYKGCLNILVLWLYLWVEVKKLAFLLCCSHCAKE